MEATSEKIAWRRRTRSQARHKEGKDPRLAFVAEGGRIGPGMTAKAPPPSEKTDVDDSHKNL